MTHGLAIIGNCSYSALLKEGSVEWLCWPRPDSSFVFGPLLDREQGGAFAVEGVDASEVEQSYFENTNVLRTVFRGERGEFELIDFAPRFNLYDRFFKPSMLVRILRPLSGEPRARVRCRPTYEYGLQEIGRWRASNHIEFTGFPTPVRLTTNLPLTYVEDERPFLLERDRHLVLTWGEPLEAGLEETAERFLERTLDYWRRWVKGTRVPRDYQNEVVRSALALKLHQYDDTGALLAATTTSIPEHPGSGRTWDYRFCWLRDAYFTLNALERLGPLGGDGALPRVPPQPLRGEGRRPPARVPDQRRLGGDRARAHSPLRLQRRRARAHRKPGLRARPERRLRRDGAGREQALPRRALRRRGAEAHGRRHDRGPRRPDGRATRRARRRSLGVPGQDATAQLLGADALGRLAACRRGRRRDSTHPSSPSHARAVEKRAAELLETRCWNEEIGALTQVAGEPQLDAALLLAVHLGYFGPDDPRASRHVDAIRASLSVDGGLLRRYTVQDDFGHMEAAFTVCTFWLVEALALIGRTDEARELFERLLTLDNGLGLYSEDILPDTLEQSGNFPQTYSHVGLINAAFRLSRRWD